MTIEQERQRFEELGINEFKPFKLEELTGVYVIDFENRCVYEVSRGYKGVYQTLDSNKIVHGLYEHILDRTWHIKKEDKHV